MRLYSFRLTKITKQAILPHTDSTPADIARFSVSTIRRRKTRFATFIRTQTRFTSTLRLRISTATRLRSRISKTRSTSSFITEKRLSKNSRRTAAAVSLPLSTNIKVVMQTSTEYSEHYSSTAQALRNSATKSVLTLRPKPDSTYT